MLDKSLHIKILVDSNGSLLVLFANLTSYILLLIK